MKEDTAKAMQEALQAAVSRMRGGDAATAPPTTPLSDLIGGVVSSLPKLLQNNEANEELIEKLDEKIESLHKGDITDLRAEMVILRKQCQRLVDGQEETWRVLQDIRRQQRAANLAIAQHLEAITQHLARMTIIDNLPLDVGDDVSGSAPTLPGSQPRSGANNDQRRVRQKTAKNPSRTRS
jgi:chromosome segregation ATPase